MASKQLQLMDHQARALRLLRPAGEAGVSVATFAAAMWPDGREDRVVRTAWDYLQHLHQHHLALRWWWSVDMGACCYRITEYGLARLAEYEAAHPTGRAT